MITPDTHVLLAMHEASIRRFGGAPGVRDMRLVESAVGRVQTALGYNPEMDVAEAAAMICHAVMKNHAFIDGNKRTGYGALVMTLAGNGYRLVAEDREITDMMIATAAGHDGHEPLAAWVRDRMVPDETYRFLSEHDAEAPAEESMSP